MNIKEKNRVMTLGKSFHIIKRSQKFRYSCFKMSSGFSSTSSSITGLKRSFSENMYGNYLLPSVMLRDLFVDTGNVANSEPSNQADASNAATVLEFKEHSQLNGCRGVILLPLEGAEAEESMTWDHIGATRFGVYVVEANFVGSGGGLLLQYMGSEDGVVSLLDMERKIRLLEGPKWFLTAKQSQHGNPSEVEKMIDKVLAGAAASTTQAGAVVTASSGGFVSHSGAPMGDGCAKKYAGCQVEDFNGDFRRVSGKDGAAKKMIRIAALLREMEPARLEIMCPDYTFEVSTFWSECVRHLDRHMGDADPMLSLSRMRELLDLPVCVNKKAFEAWLLGVYSPNDFMFSLHDFAPLECTGWHEDLDHKGRHNLWRAFEGWIEFQCVFKGTGFRSVIQPLRDLWLSSLQFFPRYHNSYIHWKLEALIREYFYEVATTRGRVAKLYGSGSIVDQADCVDLLRGMLATLISAVREGSWEAAPHPIFYAPRSPYSMAINKHGTAKGGERSDVSETVNEGKGQGYSERKNLHVSKPGSHKNGLCMWYLAGMLKLQNKANEVYVCKDSSARHVALRTVSLGVVRKLINDKEFMTCINGDLKERLRKAVEDQSDRFAK